MEKRFYQLDFLKYVCSLFLLFHHFQQHILGDYSLVFFGGRIYIGYITELFFILSGFFLGGKMKLKKNQDTRFLQFVGLKYIKFLPTILLSVTLFSIVDIIYRLLINSASWLYNNIEYSLVFFIRIITLQYCGGVFNYQPAPNDVLWFLCSLFICYTWYWLILWFAKRVNVNPIYMFAFMSFIGIIITQRQLDIPYFNSITSRGYMCFFWGIVLKNIYDYIEKKEALLIINVI